ncbi:MAG: hypothetical protein K6347_08335 [Campylobacterales bacterium]
MLELLVVLFLLSLLYSVALFTFKYHSVEKKIAHENLRELLAPYLNSESPVELLCYDDCQHCIIIRDDEKLAHVENIFFSPSLEIYRPDIYGELKKSSYLIALSMASVKRSVLVTLSIPINQPQQ